MQPGTAVCLLAPPHSVITPPIISLPCIAATRGTRQHHALCTKILNFETERIFFLVRGAGGLLFCVVVLVLRLFCVLQHNIHNSNSHSHILYFIYIARFDLNFLDLKYVRQTCLMCCDDDMSAAQRCGSRRRLRGDVNRSGER